MRSIIYVLTESNKKINYLEKFVLRKLTLIINTLKFETERIEMTKR